MDRNEARRRAEEIVSRMTLAERASQLSFEAPAIPRLGIPAYNWWNEALHGVARAGTATVFPQAIGMAASFDEELVKLEGGVIAEEGRAKYNMQSACGDRDIYKGLTFWSPNINIFRDPRWGRGQETYGEDPYLTSRLGVAFVKGVQGDGPYMKAAACAKHFAAHSGPEGLRHGFDARVSPKDLRETYLPAFESLVKEAGVEGVMGAYNRTNGEACCASKTLLCDILRGEWGFEGYVTSDCGAIADIHMHHRLTDTAEESAALALKCGCDLNCGHVYLEVMRAYEDGLVTEEEITRSCVALFTTRVLLGLFADDCEYDSIPYSACDSDENAALALRAARESIVLLKNDGVLPLDRARTRTVAVIGPNADSVTCLKGNYYGESSRWVTFLEGIRAAAAPGTRVLYSRGSDLYRRNTDGQSLPGQFLAEAKSMAQMADVAVLCLGLDETIEGEELPPEVKWGQRGDKTDLELPSCQKELLDAVLSTGKPVVLVCASGSALRLEGANAILEAWYPGQAGGTALGEILFGDVSPSGRLPVTFYRGVEDLPDFTDYSMEGRTYRYYRGEPLYPFGSGLSYARFRLSGAKYEGGAVTLTVSNESGIDADEVVQVYAAYDSPIAPPNPVLCGFARVRVSAGGSRSVSVPIDRRAFTLVNEEGERVDAAPSRLFAGGCAPDPVSRRMTETDVLEIAL